ncbi:MAG: glycogen synthase [Proteobacteria bacterium]|jgi:starch synthase|nr:glycogen synthase [Pseudomonadota bacterium]
MNILFVSSEVSPFSTSGGMGAVCGALSTALARRGHRVAVVSPGYSGIEADDSGESFDVLLAGSHQTVRFSQAEHQGVHHLFVEHPWFRRSGLYGDANGEFGDNHLRFALLSRGAIEAARRVPVGNTPLGEEVLFHVHDWQTALVPCYLEGLYRPVGLFPGASTVLTIHNLAHQGRFGPEVFNDLELPPRWFTPWALECFDDLNLLKGGLLHANQLTTVSPTFAWEITTPNGGFGLDPILRFRQKVLTGIRNGIDTDEWDPSTDPQLPAHYGPADFSNKLVCKSTLQNQLGLDQDADSPLIGSVGRLDPQKGVELLIESVPWFVQQGAQLAILGSAAAVHRHYEHQLRQLADAYPGRVAVHFGFSDQLAHRIHAGADLFSMPSHFEPCGLNQLYSLRYGTLPVVRSTGGLADSVTPFDPHQNIGTGWRFEEYTGSAYRWAFFNALYTWREHREAFAATQRRAMEVDVSWDAAVPHYEAVYERAIARSER